MLIVPTTDRLRLTHHERSEGIDYNMFAVFCPNKSNMRVFEMRRRWF